MRPTLTDAREISVRPDAPGLKKLPAEIFLPRARAPRCFPFARREIEPRRHAAMTKNARLILLAVFALALSFLTPDARSALAQTTVTGDWSASTSSDKIDKQRKWDDSDKAEKAEKPENPDKLYLSFERRTERGGHSNM